jgi:uncharacterized protein (TIGR02118 family)
MYKLLILFSHPYVEEPFIKGWQKFMGMAEQMPGLQKEAISEIDETVFAQPNASYKKVHELYFNSREDLEVALASEAGQKAGKWLHSFTNGRFSLMIAKHLEATSEEFKT